MEKTQVDLSNYRLEKARSDLETAAENLEKKRFSHQLIVPIMQYFMQPGRCWHWIN
ncbi:MAG TPA: hypothetical protein VK186_27235 [Candidatus Deferrimicrobium sp.]|nr:hypothetical protein [Candidatus Kapabacteria bacterium]HLP62563.1 hypothetical protein [Candidatus Deferrimicrobium sp.]